MMVWQPHYYRPPKVYAEAMARRQQDAARDAERRAHADGKRIAEAIEEHGERMSEEGRGLLVGLGETLRKIGEMLRG